MCHACWYGYDTPKWRAIECSMIEWRREEGLKDIKEGRHGFPSHSLKDSLKISEEWTRRPLLYDPWFETEECKQWCLEKDYDLWGIIQKAIKQNENLKGEMK